MSQKSSDRPTHAVAPEIDPKERRRYSRIRLDTKARVLDTDGGEHACLVVNISAGGVLLKTKNPPPQNARVVVYIDEIGRFEGRVVRAGKHSFAVDYRSRRGKTQRTADALIEAANNQGRRMDRRASPRMRQSANAPVRLESGVLAECAILDISLTGASIAIDPRPRLGEHITVGKMKAKVVRRHDQGVGVVFVGPASQIEDVFDESGIGDPDDAAGAKFARSFGKKPPLE